MYWSVIGGYGLYELHVYMRVKTVTGGEGEGERARASLSMKPVMHEGHVEPVVSI